MANTKNSIYLSEELQSYLENECKKYGMGKSAYISMVLTMQKQQANAINELSKFDYYIKKMEELIGSGKLD